MPAKKVEKKESSVDYPSAVIEPIFEEEPVKVEAPSDTVKVKVKVGTLGFEDGTFQKGDEFKVSRERAKLFDPKDIQIVEA